MHAVSAHDAYANLALPAALRDANLHGRDAALATELVHGTLRRRGFYDEVLSRCVDRDLDRLDLAVLDVLRLGTHQLLAMRVPAHAAVATGVELSRAVAGQGPAKLVNAVLRKVASRDADAWIAELTPGESDPIGHAALVHAHPRWIVEAFRDALGGSLSETEAALAADNVPPKVTLAAWPGRTSTDELAAEGLTAGRYSPYAFVLDGGDPHRIKAVRQGRAGVQDEGSQLVALALSRVPLAPTSDERADRPELWLDMCAGPGGKAALLAGLAEEAGARLVAAERQAHRARLVARALRGARSAVGTVVADATEPAWTVGRFDRVLVDAPCTGLGALRRRPEARWRRSPDDLDELHALQVALLRSALASVRPGGVVAYATCSPHLRETRDVVAAVLADRPGTERIDARPFLAGVPELGTGPDVQLWPHRHGTDAMYLALLRG